MDQNAPVHPGFHFPGEPPHDQGYPPQPLGYGYDPRYAHPPTPQAQIAAMFRPIQAFTLPFFQAAADMTRNIPVIGQIFPNLLSVFMQ